MVDLSVLEQRDVQLALGAMLFNTTLVIAAWFGRVYWMHAIEKGVNKLQVGHPPNPPHLECTCLCRHLTYVKEIS